MNRATQMLRATGPPAHHPVKAGRRRPAPPKNRAAAALTTTLPSTETIMASMTLTLPAEMASPAAALSFCSAHDVILALDLGTTTGFAIAGARSAASPAARPSSGPTAGRAAACGSCASSAGSPRSRTRPAASTSSLRTGPQSRRRRRGTCVWRLARDPHRLVRSPRDRLPGRPGRHDQAAHHRQGQRRQGRGDRRDPRARIQSCRRQRGRRARHPAVGDRDAGRRAMTRVRLPDRRFAETVALEHGGTRFMVTIGFYPDGRPVRCSPMARAAAPPLDALLADACVVVSCLIQHGAEPRDLAAQHGPARQCRTRFGHRRGRRSRRGCKRGPAPDRRGGQRMTGEQMLQHAAAVIAERGAAYGDAATSMAASQRAGRSRSATPLRRRRSCCA